MAYSVSGGKDPEIEVENPLKEIDGDFRKVAMIDPSRDDGLPITGGYTFNSGRPVEATHMPTRLRRSGPVHQPLLVILGGYGGSLLVSAAFRDLVEELEPGVHQFFPMTIEQSGRVLGTHYLFVVCNRLDTIDREKSVPPPPPGRPYRPLRDGTDRLVFSAAAIGNHHAWIDKFVRGTCISNTLFGRIRDAGLRGLRYTEYAEGA